MITGIAFTGMPGTDINRAREFYEGVFSLKPAMESVNGNQIMIHKRKAK
jgi:catechol 2,3-dioxygenase-like lactoylglutathione lyase family enzyme